MKRNSVHVKDEEQFLQTQFKKADNKPVIDEKVVFLSVQNLPDIRLMFVLFVQCNVLGKSLLQQRVQTLCLLPLVVDHHEHHIRQPLTLQLLVQAIQSAIKSINQ